MNKTLTVNIGGMVFHIEEFAYDTLKKYLEAIRSHFTTGDGRDEIMQDIEGRIAEMFSARIGTARQVVEMPDVEYMMGIMGKPEQFDESQAHDEKAPSASSSAYNTDIPYTGPRKLYRDEDDKMIGGVCAGLSYRLGVDVIWLRLAFIALFFFGTGGFWIYLILWIAMPKALTNAQKLEMKGAQVNLENLKKNFDESGVLGANTRSGLQRILDVILGIIKAVIKVFAYIFAVVFGLAAVGILIALVTAILGVIGVAGIGIPIFISDVFIDKSQQFWAVLAMTLIIGIPVFYILYKIVKWIFKINTSYPWIQFSALALWILGLVIGFFTGVDIAREFSQDNSKRTTNVLAPLTTDTLTLNLISENEGQDYGRRGRRFHVGIFNDSWSVTTGEKVYSIPGSVKFDIQKAVGDRFELIQLASSRGRTAKEAYENAQAINYQFEQKESQLNLNEGFAINRTKKFRDQEVSLVLKVPIGKTVFITDEMKSILNDVKNVTDTWDWDMAGHYWKMTEKGLICVDHDFSEKENGDESDEELMVNSDDLNIDGNDANVKINKDGITITSNGDTIKARDIEVKIGSDGIKIKKEKK